MNKIAIALLVAAGCGGGSFASGSAEQADGSDMTSDDAGRSETGNPSLVDAGAPDATPWIVCDVPLDGDASVQFSCSDNRVEEPDGAGPFMLQLLGYDPQGHITGFAGCDSMHTVSSMVCPTTDASASPWCTVFLLGGDAETDPRFNQLGNRHGRCVQQ